MGIVSFDLFVVKRRGGIPAWIVEMGDIVEWVLGGCKGPGGFGGFFDHGQEEIGAWQVVGSFVRAAAAAADHLQLFAIRYLTSTYPYIRYKYIAPPPRIT